MHKHTVISVEFQFLASYLVTFIHASKGDSWAVKLLHMKFKQFFS